MDLMTDLKREDIVQRLLLAIQLGNSVELQ